MAPPELCTLVALSVFASELASISQRADGNHMKGDFSQFPFTTCMHGLLTLARMRALFLCLPVGKKAANTSPLNNSA